MAGKWKQATFCKHCWERVVMGSGGYTPSVCPACGGELSGWKKVVDGARRRTTPWWWPFPKYEDRVPGKPDSAYKCLPPFPEPFTYNGKKWACVRWTWQEMPQSSPDTRAELATEFTTRVEAQSPFTEPATYTTSWFGPWPTPPSQEANKKPAKKRKKTVTRTETKPC